MGLMTHEHMNDSLSLFSHEMVILRLWDEQSRRILKKDDQITQECVRADAHTYAHKLFM